MEWAKVISSFSVLSGNGVLVEVYDERRLRCAQFVLSTSTTGAEGTANAIRSGEGLEMTMSYRGDRVRWTHMNAPYDHKPEIPSLISLAPVWFLLSVYGDSVRNL